MRELHNGRSGGDVCWRDTEGLFAAQNNGHEELHQRFSSVAMKLVAVHLLQLLKTLMPCKKLDAGVDRAIRQAVKIDDPA